MEEMKYWTIEKSCDGYRPCHEEKCKSQLVSNPHIGEVAAYRAMVLGGIRCQNSDINDGDVCNKYRSKLSMPLELIESGWEIAWKMDKQTMRRFIGAFISCIGKINPDKSISLSIPLHIDDGSFITYKLFWLLKKHRWACTLPDTSWNYCGTPMSGPIGHRSIVIFGKNSVSDLLDGNIIFHYQDIVDSLNQNTFRGASWKDGYHYANEKHSPGGDELKSVESTEPKNGPE
jgi:hypothetical protein